MAAALSLTDYWFANERLWFSARSSDDSSIAWQFRTYHPKNVLEYIIWYDQIKRHIARYDQLPYDKSNIDLAVAYAKTIIDSLESYPPVHQVFILLPFRHTKTKANLQFCIDQITILMTADPTNKYYRRFHNATVQAMTVAMMPFEVKLEFESKVDVDNSVEFEFASMLDPNCTFDFKSNIVVTKVKNFGIKSGIGPSIDVLEGIDPKIIISLRGGVDSMVCLVIALIMGFKPTALFINYGNREESDDEIRFIAWFCRKLDVPFYCRSIDEIKRTKDNRSFYEKHTRDIRFASYAHIAEMLADVWTPIIPVVLGHNKNDAEENILRNIENGCSLENLKGMRFKHMYTNNGINVQIFRPLLSVGKDWIISFAHDHNIPYLRNSTPSWSERGKLRENVIGHIPQTILDGLIAHADVVQGMHAQLMNVVHAYEVNQWDVDTCNVNNMRSRNINTRNWSFTLTNYECSAFWEIMLMRVVRFRISRKNLINLMTRIKSNTKKYDAGGYHQYNHKRKCIIQMTTGMHIEIKIINGVQTCTIVQDLN